MRFSDNGYYVERYVKCDNCGILIYGDGISAESASGRRLFCSDWCHEWHGMREAGEKDLRLPLPREGIHETA